MCRMMAVAADGPIDAQLFARFRSQARDGMPAPGDTGGHADGWGIVRYQNGMPAYAGRSALDATIDPAYPKAVASLADARGISLAHVRKASVGATDASNSHPFVRGAYAFCHNGTVRGVARHGWTDSESLFDDVHQLILQGAAPAKALAEVAARVQAAQDFTSFTCLMTDGRTLWALRLAGTAERCGDELCAPDYYTLGHATIENALVVSQEHEFLGLSGSRWASVPQGCLLEASGPEHLRISRVV